MLRNFPIEVAIMNNYAKSEMIKQSEVIVMFELHIAVRFNFAGASDDARVWAVIAITNWSPFNESICPNATGANG